MKTKNNPAYPDTHRTIAIDFDGVIHDDSKGFNGGKVEGLAIEGAERGLKTLKMLGFKLVLFSAKCRKDRPLLEGKTGKQLINEWLYKKRFDKYIDEVTSEKPSAILYIDDRGYRFDNWINFIDFFHSSFSKGVLSE